MFIIVKTQHRLRNTIRWNFGPTPIWRKLKPGTGWRIWAGTAFAGIGDHQRNHRRIIILKFGKAWFGHRLKKQSKEQVLKMPSGFRAVFLYVCSIISLLFYFFWSQKNRQICRFFCIFEIIRLATAMRRWVGFRCPTAQRRGQTWYQVSPAVMPVFLLMLNGKNINH